MHLRCIRPALSAAICFANTPHQPALSAPMPSAYGAPRAIRLRRIRAPISLRFLLGFPFTQSFKFLRKLLLDMFGDK